MKNKNGFIPAYVLAIGGLIALIVVTTIFMAVNKNPEVAPSPTLDAVDPAPTVENPPAPTPNTATPPPALTQQSGTKPSPVLPPPPPPAAPAATPGERDLQRISDLKNVKEMLTKYYAQKQMFPAAGWSNLDAALRSANIGVKFVPNDPLRRTDPSRSYYYGVSADMRSYVLGAKFEVTKSDYLGFDPEGTVFGVDCTDPVYCIKGDALTEIHNRDGQRAADLAVVAIMLEKYQDKYLFYPASSWSNLELTLTNAGLGITSLPSDPAIGATYHYTYDASANGLNYVLSAKFEASDSAELRNDVDDNVTLLKTTDCGDPIYCVRGNSLADVAKRDVRRISDLKTVQGALEKYFAERHHYPPAGWQTMAYEIAKADIGLNVVPTDPISWTKTPYNYDASANGLKYVLSATLEDRDNAALAADIDSASGLANNIDCGDPTYCVRS